jgi:hypothetical protein
MLEFGNGRCIIHPDAMQREFTYLPTGHLTIRKPAHGDDIEKIVVGKDGSLKQFLRTGFEIHQRPDGSSETFRVTVDNGRATRASIGTTPAEPLFQPPPPMPYR